MEIKYETKKESREAYKKYVDSHVAALGKAFEEFGMGLCRYIAGSNRDDFDEFFMDTYNKLHKVVLYGTHDKSKYSEIEFDAYAANFYTSKEDLEESSEEEIKENFDNAWKHHHDANPHHPEFHRININGEISYKKMSNSNIVEMILDWIAVSMVYKSDVLDWWDNSPSGFKEKSKMLDDTDITIINNWLINNKDRLNFKES